MSASNPSRPIKQAFVQHTSRSFASQRPATTPSPPAKRSQSSPTKYASYSKAKKAFSPQASIASPPALRKELAPPAPKPFLQPAEKIQALPTEKPRSPRSFEEETKMRRLAGMQSTTAILTQTLPPHLMKKAIKSNPHMSTTHLLRRFGNPHRRVVHQMLRDQNEKIIREMKKMQLITAKSSDTSQKQDSKPVQVTNVAVESK